MYYSLGGKDSLEGRSRSFVIEKIQHSAEFQNFLSINQAARMFFGKLDVASSFFEKSITQLERADLVKICKDFGIDKLIREDAKKSDIVKTLLGNVSTIEVLKNKLILQRLRPKYISTLDIRSLKKELEFLKTEVSDVSDNIRSLSDKIWTVDNEMKELSVRLKSVEGIFEVGSAPDLQTYLKALYEEAVALGEKPSPDSFHGIAERLQRKLGIDERTFILKGVELLLAHYFLSHVRDLPWKPAFEEFLKVVREEFDKVKITGDQAEIPKLRTNVTRRMGISDEMFDNLLVNAWKEAYVKLDVGAPIGEYDVKYLVTPEGNKFYYVKLKR